MTREEYLQQQRSSTVEDPFLTQGSKANYLSIKEGVNKFRFYPAHDIDKNFLVDKKVSWMEVEQDKRDANGKIVQGQKEIRRKPIFDAVVHGGLSADPIELYIDFAKNTAIPNFTQDEAKAKAIIEEFRAGMKKGIWPQRSKVGYADEYTGNGKNFGILEIKLSIANAMRDEAKKMLSSEGPVINIWTDIEEAFCAIVTKDSVAGKSDPKKYYSVEPESQMVGKYNKQYVPTPLDDDSFNKFISSDPIENLFKNRYTLQDFLWQIEGLQRFEAYLASINYPINVFGYEAFLSQINALRAEIEAKVAAGVLKQSNFSNNDSAPVQQTIQSAPTVQPVATQVVATPAPQATAPVKTQEEIDREEFEAFKAAQRAKQAQQAAPVEPPAPVQATVAAPAQTTAPEQAPTSDANLSIKERFALLQQKIAGQ